MGPKTENDILPKVCRQKRGTEKQRGVKRAQRSRWLVWMKKVRNVRWHGVVREALKAQASNLVLDPRFNWKPVQRFKQ